MLCNAYLRKPCLLVVDAYNIAHSVAHTSLGEQPRGVAEGFLSTLERVIRALEPARVVVCWDSGLDPARCRLFPEYKKHRHDRELTPADSARRAELDRCVSFLRDRALTLFGIDQLIGVGPVEADDLMYLAVEANKHYEEYETIVILSTDADMDQLLTPANPDIEWKGPDVRRLSLRELTIKKEEYQAGHRLRHRLRDGAWLYTKCGWWPEAHVFARAFIGDRSDNIPGVHGVGEKTMAKLLQAHGGPTGLIAALGDVKCKAIVETKRADLLRMLKRNLALMRLRPPARCPMHLEGTAARGPAGAGIIAAALAELKGCKPWGDMQYRDRWLGTFQSLLERRSDAPPLSFAF